MISRVETGLHFANSLRTSPPISNHRAENYNLDANVDRAQLIITSRQINGSDDLSSGRNPFP